MRHFLNAVGDEVECIDVLQLPYFIQVVHGIFLMKVPYLTKDQVHQRFVRSVELKLPTFLSTSSFTAPKIFGSCVSGELQACPQRQIVPFLLGRRPQ